MTNCQVCRTNIATTTRTSSLGRTQKCCEACRMRSTSASGKKPHQSFVAKPLARKLA